MFGRATITLGIGPHSSFTLIYDTRAHLLAALKHKVHRCGLLLQMEYCGLCRSVCQSVCLS